MEWLSNIQVRVITPHQVIISMTIHNELYRRARHGKARLDFGANRQDGAVGAYRGDQLGCLFIPSIITYWFAQQATAHGNDG